MKRTAKNSGASLSGHSTHSEGMSEGCEANGAPAASGTPPGGAGAGRTLSVTLPLPRLLLTINRRRRMHWSWESREVASQRKAAKMHARDQLGPDFAPLTGTVRLDVDYYPYYGQVAPDEAAQWEATKPWVDGLQDAGLFAGGDDRVVVHGAVRWHRDKRTGEVVITLTEQGG